MTTPGSHVTPAERHPTATAGQDSETRSIAEVAEEFGVTHRTLRHYEAIGLITPQREGTRRLFRKRDRIRLALVLRGKRLGFPLEEIRTIVNMYDDPPGEAGQLRYVLDQIALRREDLQNRRRDVEIALAELAALETRCAAELATLEGSTAD
ncbi:MerR family transcriptional regulator [Gephyromycinifex aptenodytis]|uniref:MerR family transcriptional regulator n=1 Tax=Gephyromycinifex aptenodytis TaxID=2716227 RepID=UPI0029CA49C1|nr:MerR family DNA-binding transcriptional regulator [Gephyromycinifex aptenodytis]